MPRLRSPADLAPRMAISGRTWLGRGSPHAPSDGGPRKSGLRPSRRQAPRAGRARGRCRYALSPPRLTVPMHVGSTVNVAHNLSCSDTPTPSTRFHGIDCICHSPFTVVVPAAVVGGGTMDITSRERHHPLQRSRGRPCRQYYVLDKVKAKSATNGLILQERIYTSNNLTFDLDILFSSDLSPYLI